jgi:hypothetical protein
MMAVALGWLSARIVEAFTFLHHGQLQVSASSLPLSVEAGF